MSESCRAKRGYPCDKAFCAALFDELFAHQQELSGRLLTLDIDAVWYSDDWSGQQGPLFSPELWRQWIKPRFAGIIEKTHKAGKRVILHCCGNLEAFICSPAKALDETIPLDKAIALIESVADITLQ